MKKQIISLLILISLSFQSVYPAFDTVERKNNDAIPSLWHPSKFMRFRDEAEKKYLDCFKVKCNQEREIWIEANKKRVDEKRRISLWQRVMDTFQGKDPLKKESDAIKVCLKNYCEKEKKEYIALEKRRLKVYGIAASGQILSMLLLLIIFSKLDKRSADQFRPEVVTGE